MLLALTLAAACGLAARCYPPGTHVVVLIEGVYTSYDPRGPDDYAKLKDALATAGFDRAKLLHFSYNGGSFDESGAWQPNAYSCASTDRPADENLAYIESLLREYRARHPEAHFTLIGHSLGGRLAFLEGAREATRPPEQQLGVTGVVTLSAPLLGVGADKKIALDAVGCGKTYAAAAEIVTDRADPNIAATRAAQVEAMRAAGIRVATIGNTNDCLYALSRCIASEEFTDESETQFLPNADFVATSSTAATLSTATSSPCTTRRWCATSWHSSARRRPRGISVSSRRSSRRGCRRR
jgi:pimeloyl-ACP methyl ester carboxylesterase